MCVVVALVIVLSVVTDGTRPPPRAAAAPVAEAVPERPSSAPGAAAAAAVVEGHPFSAPAWYPLRSSRLDSVNISQSTAGRSALVACVVNNGCPGVHPHAVDFAADAGDGVYAAGAGRLHIVSVPSGCADGKTTRPWAWIDHGGGIVSRYHHLNAPVTSLNGEMVNAGTKIGEVGVGGLCSNPVAYLHFEIRNSGVNGNRYAVPQLSACRPSDGRQIRLPEAVGYARWDDVPYRQVLMPAVTSGCIGAPQGSTPARPSLQAEIGNERVRLAWSSPSRTVNAVAVEMRTLRSTAEWSVPSYRYFSGQARAYEFTGLINGRTYMFRVAYHNKAGYSAWSHERVVSPAAPPSQPSFRRATVTSDRIGYGWYRSDGNGRSITSYQLAIRRATSTEWTTTRVGNVSWHDFEPLRSASEYVIRVRATSSAGTSDWSTARAFTTLR